jgi:hypothetical protein
MSEAADMGLRCKLRVFLVQNGGNLGFWGEVTGQALPGTICLKVKSSVSAWKYLPILKMIEIFLRFMRLEPAVASFNCQGAGFRPCVWWGRGVR